MAQDCIFALDLDDETGGASAVRVDPLSEDEQVATPYFAPCF
jgi:hypothetical protein